MGQILRPLFQTSHFSAAGENKKLEILDFIQVSEKSSDEWPKPIDAFFINENDKKIVGDSERLPKNLDDRKRFILVWPTNLTLTDSIFCDYGYFKIKEQYDSVPLWINDIVIDRNIIAN